jgi:hypothetical protein
LTSTAGRAYDLATEVIMPTRLGLMLLALVALPGCPTTTPVEEGSGTVVQPGKEDNFLSLTAGEYQVEGVTTVTVETDLATATEEQKLARVRQLIPLKQVVIGWFLNQYLAAKESDAANAGYGGFDALTKNGAYEEMNITAKDATTYEFTFRQEFGGKVDLLEKLPTTVGEDGRRYFNLTIGRISNDDMARLETNSEWYRDAPWSEFDPGKVDASRLDLVTLAVWREKGSVDGWLDYTKLFADGKVTVGVHFGWDYHSEYHLKHSREVYDWLIAEGFTSPVASYDAYGRLSGPLQKTISVNGRQVTVEVSLFWGKPGTDWDPGTASGGVLLENDMRQSFAEREVIVFSGHSGPFYGFALANWRVTDEGDLDDSEVASLAMPADVYQVVIAEGCDTYGLGEAFRLNPAKPGAANLDVVTTTSFSNASTADAVKDSLRAVFGSKSGGFVAKTWGEVLRDLDSNSYWFTTMYGVHAIDDNPHGHPFAQAGKVCQKCSVDADCGPAGNKCTKLGTGEKFCTYLCTADDGCPEGYQCMAVASGSTITSRQCAPRNLTCTVAPPVSGPAAVINEVFASPKSPGGDANGDGAVSATNDEFIEVVNVSGAALDLTGWTVSDTAMTRLKLPSGTTLAAGQALVIFGGGTATAFTGLEGAVVLVSSQSHLGLNNTGDRVILRDKLGATVDQMSYGTEGGAGKALVRERDGDPTARFVAHGGAGFSPGRKADGSAF